jgi:DNA-binding transcriptional MerR regulator
MMAVAIPDKQYFKIGEVSEILELEPYVLRYWESEFKILKPTRTRAQQRLYHRKDLDLLMEIKNLLYIDKLTIAGAKQRLQTKKKRAAADRKVIKMRRNEDSGELTGLKNDENYVELDDFRTLILDIRKELEELRSKIEK